MTSGFGRAWRSGGCIFKAPCLYLYQLVTRLAIASLVAFESAANATVLLGLAIAQFVVVKSMTNTTVLRGLAIAKFVVVKTVANATVRRGPAPAELRNKYGSAGNCPYVDSSICNWVGNEKLDSFKIKGGGPNDHNCQFGSPGF